MSEVEKQATSLELSQELKKAGYPQEGLWRWGHLKGCEPEIALNSYTEDKEGVIHYYIAPTVAELGEALPQYIRSRGYMLTIVKDDNDKWWIGYPNHKGIGVSDIKWTIEEAILANALAKMWLYLKKEKLL